MYKLIIYICMRVRRVRVNMYMHMQLYTLESTHALKHASRLVCSDGIC